MKHYVSAASYLLAITATIAVWNADIDAAWSWVGLGIWACASVLLGAITGRIACFLLAFAAIPIAVPFGLPDAEFRWSEPLPLWWPVAVNSFFAAGLIFIAALGRRAFDGRKGPTRRKVRRD